LWSLLNALFLLFVGHESEYTDKFSTFNFHVEPQEQSPTKSVTHCVAESSSNEECHQEIIVTNIPGMVIYSEGVAIDTAPSLPEKQKNRRKRGKKQKNLSEVPQKQSMEIHTASEVASISHKPSNNLPNSNTQVKGPSERKKVNKDKEAQPKPKTNSNNNMQMQQRSVKVGKAEAPVLPKEPSPTHSHSMLKKNLSPFVEVPMVKPIRQPIGPTIGSKGFSNEYRKSRVSAVMAF